MEWTPCNSSPGKFVGCERDRLFVAAIKSYTKSFTRFVYVTAVVRL